MPDDLTAGDRYTLRKASERGSGSWPPDAVERYSFYRRRGHCKSDAIAYAIAWAKNVSEQADRRRPLDLQPYEEVECPV